MTDSPGPGAAPTRPAPPAHDPSFETLMLTLAQIPGWAVGILVVLFVVISLLMMLIVLVQKPQGGGLSEAFGSSSGGGATAFGAKTGDALTIATVGIFVLFIGFAVGLNYIVRPAELSPVPAASAAPPAQSPAQSVNQVPPPASVTTTDPTTGQPRQIELTPIPNPMQNPQSLPQSPPPAPSEQPAQQPQDQQEGETEQPEEPAPQP